MTNFRTRLAEIKSQIREVGVDEVRDKLKADNSAILIDVRQRDEIAEGRLEGALAIPRGLLELEIEKAVSDKNQEIILYCAGGTRSAHADHDCFTRGVAAPRQ